MNDKCPFCGGDLVGCMAHSYCRNNDCVMCDDPMPRELLDKLETTRKVLDVAVDGLKEIQDKGEYVNPIDIAEYVLEQIESITKKE